MIRPITYIIALAILLAATSHAAEAPASQPATGTITGIIVDDSGKPVSGCIVAAQQAARKMRLPLSATSDDKGAFKIENAPEGEYNLKIRTSDAKGKATKTVRVVADKTVDTGTLKLKYK